MEPQIRFCTSADGVRIAYSIRGEGPPLVMILPWLVPREVLQKFAGMAAFTERLAAVRFTISLDRRGISASQRDVDHVSLQAHLADVSAVVDQLQLDRFDLLGGGEGAQVAVEYAVQHPERVSSLILWQLYASGEDIGTSQQRGSFVDLVRNFWGVARRALASLAIPGAPPEALHLYTSILRDSMSPDVAASYLEASGNTDVTLSLSRVQARTLVLGSRRNQTVPFRAGQVAAAQIPEAQFVAIEGSAFLDVDQVDDLADLVTQFLDEGRAEVPVAEAPSGLVTILFTDMEGSTTLTERLGDAKAQELRRTHDAIVREALKAQGGSETKHTGDGIMASFPSASRAIECAVAVQRAIAEHNESAAARPEPVEGRAEPLRVRIGMNAGEPVAEDADLFGTAVNLAKRICDHAEPGQILVSDVVQQLAAGKGFTFADKGEATLKGFEKPVRLHEVLWQREE